MKQVWIVLIAAYLLGCDSPPPSEDNGHPSSSSTESNSSLTQASDGETEEKDVEHSNMDADDYAIETDDSLELMASLKLKNTYTEVPYFFLRNDVPYFVVFNGNWAQAPENRFKTHGKWGIADSTGKPLLPLDYDKVYTPDATLIGCIEIEKNGKVGLFDYVNGEVLEPQFEYMVPLSKTEKPNAVGCANGIWQSIEYDTKFELANYEGTPPELSGLSFSLDEIGQWAYTNALVKRSASYEPIWTATEVLVLPSYVNRLNLLPEFIDDYAGNERNGGTGDGGLKLSSPRKSNGLLAFIGDVYKEHLDARGYIEDFSALTVVNESTNTVNSIYVNNLNKEYYCREEVIRWINDTLLEVQVTENPSMRYEFESTFNYYAIHPNGQIQQLNSHRHYDFTKFIEMDDSHFRGCFGKRITEEEKNAYASEWGDAYFNLWRSEHLSIQDLDVMRNEIFAEYGYRFKTPQWQEYFEQFDWYKPRFDNVDDQLTELDKKNIETILARKMELEKDEKSFTKKEPSGYAAPG
mgnify:CR=1 FL=1